MFFFFLQDWQSWYSVLGTSRLSLCMCHCAFACAYLYLCVSFLCVYLSGYMSICLCVVFCPSLCFSYRHVWVFWPLQHILADLDAIFRKSEPPWPINTLQFFSDQFCRVQAFRRGERCECIQRELSGYIIWYVKRTRQRLGCKRRWQYTSSWLTLLPVCKS